MGFSQDCFCGLDSHYNRHGVSGVLAVVALAVIGSVNGSGITSLFTSKDECSNLLIIGMPYDGEFPTNSLSDAGQFLNSAFVSLLRHTGGDQFTNNSHLAVNSAESCRESCNFACSAHTESMLVNCSGVWNVNEFMRTKQCTCEECTNERGDMITAVCDGTLCTDFDPQNLIIVLAVSTRRSSNVYYPHEIYPETTSRSVHVVSVGW